MYTNRKAVTQTSCISSKGILQIHDPRDLMTSLSLLQQLTYPSDHPSLAAAARKTEKNEVSTSQTTQVVCSACCSAPLLLFFCSCCWLLLLPRKLGLESKDWTSLSLITSPSPPSMRDKKTTAKIQLLHAWMRFQSQETAIRWSLACLILLTKLRPNSCVLLVSKKMQKKKKNTHLISSSSSCCRSELTAASLLIVSS